jgi:hypothetical protein
MLRNSFSSSKRQSVATLQTGVQAGRFVTAVRAIHAAPSSDQPPMAM